VSQQTVSNIECGHLEGMSLASLASVAEALGADLSVACNGADRGSPAPRSQACGPAGRVASLLVGAGWEVRAEQSFNRYGERGSVDLMGWRAAESALLVVEVKTELVDLQETVRVLDMKARVVPAVVRQENGWRPQRWRRSWFCPTLTSTAPR